MSEVLDLSSLNVFSQRFARALFAIYPEWQEFAYIDFLPHVTPGSLVVDVSAPVPQHGLTIRTNGNEVTIWCSHFTAHFDEHIEDEKTRFAQALDFIRTLLAEEICVVTIWQSEKPGVSLPSHLQLSSLGNAFTIKSGESLVPTTGQNIFVASWRGTYDAYYASEQ